MQRYDLIHPHFCVTFEEKFLFMSYEEISSYATRKRQGFRSFHKCDSEALRSHHIQKYVHLDLKYQSDCLALTRKAFSSFSNFSLFRILE